MKHLGFSVGSSLNNRVGLVGYYRRLKANAESGVAI